MPSSSSTTRRERIAALAALLAALAAGCSGPPLSECDPGLFDAYCGGASAPVVACERDTGECRWFRTSSVAANHAVSACGTEDICCERADGPWPFDDWRPPTEAARLRAVRDLGILRSLFVERERPSSDIAVSFDPELPALEAPVIECPRTMHGMFCVMPGAAVALVMQRYRAGRSLVIVLGSRGVNGEIVLEVSPSVLGDGLTARVFGITLPASDSPALGTVSCTGTGGVSLATVGSIRLSADAFDDPAASHGVLDVTLGTSEDFVLRF